MQNKLSYQLPKICCRCGEKEAANIRPIYVSQISGIGYYGLFMTTQRFNYSFGVPVCDDCSEILSKSDKKTKISRIVVSLLFSLGFLCLFNFAGYFFTGLIISIMVYIVLQLSFINRPITGPGLGGYTGRYFWFSNRKFFKQFAGLNPHFVAPHHIQQLLSQPASNGLDDTKEQSGFLWTRSNKILLFVVFISILCFSIVFCAPILISLFD